MLIDTIHHIILGFSFVDITLTYFFFYLQETKISNDYREEMNPIARNIL